MARSSLPQNYVINTGTLFEDFETLADWTKASSASSEIAVDTSIFKTGTKSLKLTGSTDTHVCIADKVLNTSLLNAGIFRTWVYLPSLTNLTSVRIYLSSTTNYSKYFSIQYNAAVLHTGWNCIETGRGDFGASGGEVWSNTFVRLRVGVYGSDDSVVAYFDSMYTGVYSRPKCLVTFDDGWDSAYNEGYTYMATKGLKGTIYIIGDDIGTADNMTLENCQTVYNAGWDLATHGGTVLTTLATQALQEAEISSNEEFLTVNGFTRASKHYAYPGGGNDANSLAALAALGYKTARTIIDRTQSNNLDQPYLLCRQAVYNTTTQAATKVFIDNAIARGNSVWLNYHILVAADADVSTKVLNSDFEAVIDYIKTKVDSNQIDCVTVSEWYEGLTNPRYRSVPITRSVAGTRTSVSRTSI